MRKPRDYDSELRALDDKAKLLRARKLQQLGELVIATGADALPTEQLAGALLAAVVTKDAVTQEEWQAKGAAFFRAKSRQPSDADHGNINSVAARGGGPTSP